MTDRELTTLQDDGCPHAEPEPACRHRWQQVYYGWRCPDCFLFYTHGTAPWEDDHKWADPEYEQE